MSVRGDYTGVARATVTLTVSLRAILVSRIQSTVRRQDITNVCHHGADKLINSDMLFHKLLDEGNVASLGEGGAKYDAARQSQPQAGQRLTG